MEAVMTVLLQVLLLGVLAAYFALMGVVCYAVVWLAYRTWRNHFSLRTAWHEGKDRLLGVGRH